MAEIVVVQKVIVEKMAEGAMADVVQQADDAHVLFDIRRRRTLVAEDFAQRRIEVLAEFASHMHGAQGVLKPAMFRRRVNPTGALQLVYVAQPLHPWRIDQRLLGHLAFRFRDGELNVAMDRVGDQRRAAEFVIDQL